MRLDKKEYSKIVSEINNKYKASYEKKEMCMHASFAEDGMVYIYYCSIVK